jgi:hypothetical protein
MPRLDVNQSGSWRRCLDFAERDIERVAEAAVVLASRCWAAKLRIRDDQNRIVAYWDKPQGWHGGLMPSDHHTVRALAQAMGDMQ